MRYKKIDLKEGISLHLLKNDKFKTNLIAIFLSTELTRENVTFDAVLSAVLRRGSQKIKTQEEISKKLEEMYGAEFDCGLDKIGENHVIKLYIETINDEFLPKNAEGILKQSFEIISDIAFNPLTADGGFESEYVEQEKENIKQIIEAKKDNKARYALFRCIEEMFKGEPTAIYKYGYIEDIEKINPKNLYERYKNLLENCKIDIFVSGNIDNTQIENLIKNNENISNLKDRKPMYKINKIDTMPKKKLEKENIIEEKMDVTQGKLVIGYDINLNDDMIKNENIRYIAMIYNAILGGTANSKLFQNVREKESLAYTTNSIYMYNKSSIFVSCGIEIENYKKAKDVINIQIQNMKNGDFSEEELENAKKVIISNITSINDEQDSEIIYFLGQELSGNVKSLEEYKNSVYNVTIEQVKEIAQNVNINTTYFLKR